MACRDVTMTGTALAYNDDKTVWTFIPVTGPIPLRQMNEFRMQLELVDPNGISVRRAYRAGNQETSWQSPVTVGSATTTVGWNYNTAYTTAPNNYRLIQFGIEVLSGEALMNGCQINLVVEARVQ